MADRRIWQLSDGSISVTNSDRRIAIDQTSFGEPYNVSVSSFWNYPFLYGTTVTQGTSKTVSIGLTAYDKWFTLHVTAYRGSDTRYWQKVIYSNGLTVVEKKSDRFMDGGENVRDMGLSFTYGINGASIEMTMTALSHASNTTVRFMKMVNMSSVVSAIV